MRYYQLLLFLLFFCLESFPQSFSLKISVVDNQQNKPVTEANIIISEKYFTISNNKGNATIDKIPAGAYSIRVSHIGYKTVLENIEINSDTTIKILLEPTTINLNDVIIISSKYEKDINSIPLPVSIVKSQQIQNSPSQTVADILKTESGISLLSDGVWGTEISIRGLNRANIVTLVDGNRIETATDISARLSMIDLNDIDRIEVIKGAVSSLYGSGATGGIVNIISKSGSYSENFKFNGKYYGGYSSVNRYYSNGINLFFTDKNWIAKLTGTFRKAGNINTPSGELSNSQFKDNSFSSSLSFKPVTNHELRLNFQQFKAFDVGIPGASGLFPDNARVTYPQETRRLYNIEYKINNLSSSLVKLSAKYFHQYISRDVENIPGIVQYIPAANGQPFRRVSVLKINPGADHNVDGAQAQADFSFFKHYFITGIDYWKRNYNGLRTRDQKIEVLNQSDSSVVRTMFKTVYEKPLPDADFYSAGLYLQDEYRLSDKININPGFRYDFIWIRNSETTNPLYEVNDGVINYNPAGQKIIWEAQKAHNKSYVFNLGVVYSLSDESNLMLNIAKSFRSPSLEERFQYIDLGNIIRVGNPNLKPEMGDFYDAGFRLFSKNINLKMDFFYNSFKDLVTEEPGIYEGSNALIKVNIGSTYLFGFEYSLNYQVSEIISFYNVISYVRGINKNDNSSLPQIPPLNGSFLIKCLISNNVYSDLTLIAFAAQNKIAIGEKTTPGYAYFNFALNFSNVSINKLHFSFAAGIENIFNKEYRNHLSTTRGFEINEPGRNFYLRTNIAF